MTPNTGNYDEPLFGYDIIEKCERRNVKFPEDVIRQIKRDLVLVVEYHPGEPVSVALSCGERKDLAA